MILVTFQMCAGAKVLCDWGISSLIDDAIISEYSKDCAWNK